MTEQRNFGTGQRDELLVELDVIRDEIERTPDRVLKAQLQLIKSCTSLVRAASEGLPEQELQQEVERLRTVETAFESQVKLLKDWIALTRNSIGTLRMKGTLQQTLEAAIQLTNATMGTIFLLNTDKTIIDSVLTRQSTKSETKSIIGKVLDKGLAGWVVRHRDVGLVTDTQNDDRWVDFADQNYEVGSALCVPIVKGDRLFGVLTLMHPQRGHFTTKTADLMLASSYQMSVILENTYLNLENQKIENKANRDDPLLAFMEIPLVGAFIIQGEKLTYANPWLLSRLGYSRDDLAERETLGTMVAPEDRPAFVEQVARCLRGDVRQIKTQVRFLDKIGEEVTMLVQGSSIQFRGRSAVMCMARRVGSDRERPKTPTIA